MLNQSLKLSIISLVALIPTNGAVISLSTPVLFPKILFLTDIKSPSFTKGFLLEPLFALAEYEIFFFTTVPSPSYLINTIFPDNGLIGPVKSIASDNVASRGKFILPGFSTRPKILTFMNFGERPLKTDFGICLADDWLNFGRNILSPSNIRKSLLSSDSFKKELRLIKALFLPPPFPRGTSRIISILDKSVKEVTPPALRITSEIVVISHLFFWYL